MRALLLFCLLPILAGANGGCGGGGGEQREAKISVDAGGGRAPDGRHEATKDAPKKDDGSRVPEDRLRDEKSPSPIVDDPHAGVAKRKKPEMELPAGILTAGSFDDNIYPPFFRSFVGKAGQNTHVANITSKLLGRRVEIFVKNGQGAPVGNARVNVSGPQGQKVELVTRSDGRTIFLSSLDQFEQEADLTVTASAADANAVSQPVEKGTDRCTLILQGAAAALPRNLDLVIVLDTTGSMKDELDFLKVEIKNIAASIRERFPNVNQRYALVCYRDIGMGDEYVTRKFDFTENIDDFRKNISAQKADGGGDIPEAMEKGLEDATKLKWRDADTARVVFLIADAPPHAKDAAETLGHINTLRKRGTAIYPVFASSNDIPASEATEVVMRGAALVTGGQYLFLTDDSGVGDAHGEPHIPYYHVEKLNALMVRMISGELSGKRLEPDAKSIIRTVGKPPTRPRQD